MGSTRRWINGTIGAMLLASSIVVVSVAADPAPPVAQAAEPIPLAVAANWQMNETGGLVMNDSGPYGIDGDIGDEVELTGSHYDFTINSPTAEYRPEHIVRVDDDDRLDPGSSDYAVEFRYRTRRSWGNVVQKGQNNTLGGYFKFEQPNGQMTCLFKWTDPNNANISRQKGVQAPPEMATNNGEWNTIRCEMRRSFGVILFINGVEAAKNGWGSEGPLPPINNNKIVSIAGKGSCNQGLNEVPLVTCDYFDGDIDYVRIEKGPPAQNEPPNMEFTSSCDKLRCTFNSSPSVDSDGRIVSRSWAFGDAGTSTQTNPTFTFPAPGEYLVVLRGTDDDGAVGVAEETVVVVGNEPPQMSFSVDCDELRCRFDASDSEDPDGDIDRYSWDFGDGGVRLNDDDPIDTHTYDSPGFYEVTLTGEDDDGARASVTQNVAVAVQPPTASFTVSCTQLTCAVDAAGSSDPDGTLTGYAWTFGDGATATGVTASRTYAAPGTYTIGLTVEDDDGATAAASRTVTVEQQGSLPPLANATRLIPLPPERVFDTREGEPGAGPKGLVTGGATIDVDVTALDSVPADAAAVAINITAIAQQPGFVTIWPSGLPRPTASSINLTAPGQVRANLVIVPVGDDGRISLFSLGDAHLLGDIAGYFTDQTTATAAGRIITQSPERLFDTREPGNGPAGGVAAGGTIEVQVLGEAGLPDDGVSAVVLNVTATAPAGPGFVTAWSGEGDRPTASIINLNMVGDTVPNQVIVPVGPDGTITFFSSTATQLLADVSGYVTDAGVAPSVTGLFVPLSPDRLFDTRPGEPGGGPKGQVAAGDTITPQIAEVAGVPADAGGVIINLTMIGTAPSFATAWPAGGIQPVASIVNVDGSDVRANGATIALGDGGDVSFFTSAAAHLLADVSGYLLQ